MTVTDKKTELTSDEIFDVLRAIRVAEAAGDTARVKELDMMLPVLPQFAIGLVQVFGKDYVKANFNLSRADEKLGEGWIDGVEHIFAFANLVPGSEQIRE